MKDKKLSSFDKNVTIFVAIFLIVIFSAVIIITNTGKIDFTVSEEKLEISSPYWADYSVTFDDIESIEFTEEDHRGSRTYGFGSVKLLMGSFENGTYGEYTRYSYTKCKSGIIITKKDVDILIISMPSETETFDFYQNLKTIIYSKDLESLHSQGLVDLFAFTNYQWVIPQAHLEFIPKR